MPPSEKNEKTMGDKTRRYLAELIQDLKTSKPRTSAPGASAPTAAKPKTPEQPQTAVERLPETVATAKTGEENAPVTPVPQERPQLFAGSLSSDSLPESESEQPPEPPPQTKALMFGGSLATSGPAVAGKPAGTAGKTATPNAQPALFSGNLSVQKPVGEKKIDISGLPGNRPKIELSEKEKALLKAFRKNES